MWLSQILQPDWLPARSRRIWIARYLLLAINDLIILIGCFITGKSVVLLKINYLQLKVVHTVRRYTITPMGRRLLWLVNCYKRITVGFSMF